MLHGQRSSRWRDSNSRPSAYKADAITTMLHRQLLWSKFVSHFQNLFTVNKFEMTFINCLSHYYIIRRTSLKTNFGFESMEPSLILRTMKKKFPDRELNPGLSGESRVSWPPRLTGMNLLSTGIEPATLGLWDPRAANCATKASCSKT